MILSASRRTDIPAYYSQWFINRLKEGYALYRNPMKHSQICKVELKPELVDCIVFWTKDPADMMDKLDLIEAWGYHYYFQFTLTPYGREIETRLRDKDSIIQTFQQLSKRLGKHRVLWRYDPIILNEELTIQYHEDMFRMLCEKLAAYTECCTISFVDLYRKLNNRVKDNVLQEISQEQMHSLAAVFNRIAKLYDIDLRACCEAADLSTEGVKPAACIDRNVIERICGYPIRVEKDRNQRLHCGCMKSMDIGAYNTCGNGCIYCYANHSAASIRKNRAKHDPASPFITD